MIKRAIAVACIALMLGGCARDFQVGACQYSSYGPLSGPDSYNPNLHYRVVIGNVIWGILLAETVIAPIYFFGFSLWEPVGVKDPVKFKGCVSN